MSKEWKRLLALGLTAFVLLTAGLTTALEPDLPADRVPQEQIGTAFTYQGRLQKEGEPVNDTCSMTFRLYDQATEGNMVAGPLTRSVPVSDSYFAVKLDFGGGVFTGDARWLGIALKCPGDAAYTTLSPRLGLTLTPYALALPGLWTQQNGSSPNLIGGYQGNTVAEGVVGATIGGGGQASSLNRVTDYYGTVGGGYNNQAGNGETSVTDTGAATVGGGYGNQASGWAATVSGGSANIASGSNAAISGGDYNRAGGDYAAVGGGLGNNASATYTTIGGGWYNTANGYGDTISGGYGNTVTASFATVAGGGRTDTGNPASGNLVSDDYGTVGGGGNNQAGSDDGNATTAMFATVGGGGANTAGGTWSTVGGGASNTAGDYNTTVAGGQGNVASAASSTVGGGWYNSAEDLAATASGGIFNHATGQSATVGGGSSNTASGAFATVPGGDSAAAPFYGQMAYASGEFATPGDAQAALYVLRNTTTSGGSWESLYLDGSSQEIQLVEGQTLVFDILIVGRSSEGESAGYHLQGMFEYAGGIGQHYTTAVIWEDDVAWDVQLYVFADLMMIQVKGNGETIRWVATMRTTEVVW